MLLWKGSIWQYSIERKEKGMPKFMKKVRLEHYVCGGTVLLLLICIFYEKNILDIGYLCLFLIYCFRMYLLKRRDHS